MRWHGGSSAESVSTSSMTRVPGFVAVSMPVEEFRTPYGSWVQIVYISAIAARDPGVLAYRCLPRPRGCGKPHAAGAEHTSEHGNSRENRQGPERAAPRPRDGGPGHALLRRGRGGVLVAPPGRH